MNIREFINFKREGTFDVQWDSRGNLDIIVMELTTGYMVSQPGGLTTPVAFGIDMGMLWNWLENNRETVETHYLGVWVDAGVIYLDISRQIFNLDTALFFGREWNQLAIWDNSNRVAITL